MSVILRTATGYAVFPRLDGSLIDMPMPAVAAGINLTAPTLSSAKIGMAFTIGSGTWSGAPVIQRDLMRDGAVFLSGVAAGSGYTPVAGDDLKTFQVREYPNGDISKAVYSPAVVVTYAAPVWNTPISDQIFVQGSGSHTIDASGLVSGSNLTWTISGPAGIEINDGVITIPSATAHAATDVTPMATNSGGSASDTFTVTITDAAPVSSGVTLPDQSYSRNTGTKTFDASVGFIGSNLVFTLTGSPPAGVTIGASTGIVSTNTVNLISATSVTVRAANGGGYVERTFSVAVVVATGAAPTLTGAAIPSRLGMIRGVSQTLSAAPSFAGAIDTWSVTGIGVTIDSAGLMTFANSATIAAQTVTVTASNAFGSISTTFPMSVAMAILALADLTLTWRTDPTGQSAPSATPKAVPAGFGTWCFDIDESKLPQPITVLGWRPDADPGNTSMGTGYHMCIRQSPQPGGLPAGVARWFARRCNPSTGATEIASWLDVVGSGVVGASRTHQFIWSSDAIVSDLRSLEYSGPSAALVANVTLTGAPAITAPTLSPSSPSIGSSVSVVDGTPSGNPTPSISRRLLLGTTAVTTPYTVVSGDAGKNLIPENTATSTLGSVTVQGAPYLILGGSVYATPTTAAEYITAMNNAPNGAIIEIPGGNKGTGWYLNPTTAKNRSGIIVRAQDRGNRPIFENAFARLTAWSGISFQYLDFQCTSADVRTTFGPLAFVLYGACSNIQIHGCYFNEYFGVVENHDGGNNQTYSYNTVEGTRCDAFRLYNVQDGLWAHHNKIINSHVNTAWTGDINRHCDWFQMAASSFASNNAVIEDNYAHTTQVDFPNAFHGVFVHSEAWAGGSNFDTWSHKNTIVRRNYFSGATVQGITLSGVKGGVFRDNYMESPLSDLSSNHCPQMYFNKPTTGANAGITGVQNVTVTNNAWPLVAGQSTLRYGNGDIAGLGGNSVTGNLIAPGSKPVGWSTFDAADVTKVGHTAAAA